MSAVHTLPFGAQTVHISTATSTPVKVGSGVLRRVVVNTTAAGAITISDAVGVIAVMKASIAEGSYAFDCQFVGSLTVVTGAASDLTICFD